MCSFLRPKKIKSFCKTIKYRILLSILKSYFLFQINIKCCRCVIYVCGKVINGFIIPTLVTKISCLFLYLKADLGIKLNVSRGVFHPSTVHLSLQHRKLHCQSHFLGCQRLFLSLVVGVLVKPK